MPADEPLRQVVVVARQVMPPKNVIARSPHLPVVVAEDRDGSGEESDPYRREEFAHPVNSPYRWPGGPVADPEWP